jgi:putative phosphoribosyl transferase
MVFRDRTDAGRRLAAALGGYANKRPAVLALPRGGVVVAAEIAHALQAPLDLILVRKIGVPSQPELAMGAVVDGRMPIIVRNEDVIRMTGVSEAEFRATCDRELAEIERRRKSYLGDRAPLDIVGCAAIVVDDGIATGATTRAALRAARARNPATLVLAVPVGPADSLDALRRETDDLVCLEEHEDFDAIGQFYDEFRQVTDREVRQILARFPDAPPSVTRPG